MYGMRGKIREREREKKKEISKILSQNNSSPASDVHDNRDVRVDERGINENLFSPLYSMWLALLCFRLRRMWRDTKGSTFLLAKHLDITFHVPVDVDLIVFEDGARLFHLAELDGGKQSCDTKAVLI